MTADGTKGIVFPPNVIPIFFSSKNLTTPPEAFKPNALPPVSKIALTFGALAIGSSNAISFVPGAPPLISTEAINGFSDINLVRWWYFKTRYF